MPTGAVKGEEVTFIRGKYVGYTGWINVAADEGWINIAARGEETADEGWINIAARGEETAKLVSVIVNGWTQMADGSTFDRVTTVRSTSIRRTLTYW
jgi:hypothetical protein